MRKKIKAEEQHVKTTAVLPLDAYTPPGVEQPRGDAFTARYLITKYDKPLDPADDEHTQFLLALFSAAKLLRREALKWRDEIDWTGNTKRVSEADIERRFQKAENCDREADLLLAEYRRGARREWIAKFPRKGPQYAPERREARKAVRS